MGRRNEMHWSRRRERTCCALGPGRKTVWLDRQGDTGKFGRRQATSCSLCRPWWAACTLLSMQDMSPAGKLVPHRWLVYYLGHSLWLAQAHPTWLASRGCHGGRCSPLCRLLPPPSSTTAPPLTVTFFLHRMILKNRVRQTQSAWTWWLVMGRMCDQRWTQWMPSLEFILTGTNRKDYVTFTSGL